MNLNIGMDVLISAFINTPIDNQMIKFVKALKAKGYKIGMVTDNKSDRINSIVKHFNWNGLFDCITVSANIGSGKDREEIFIKTVTGLNLQASECVFIDNQEKNLIIPKQMGMAVIYFDHVKRDFDQFIRDLLKLGVKFDSNDWR